jgi:transposase
MPKRQFDEQFRREAVQLVTEGGVPTRQACQDLGIGRSTLERWVATARAASPKTLSESEREELKRLRKENTQLKMERDILKKATAYFAKNSQ